MTDYQEVRGVLCRMKESEVPSRFAEPPRLLTDWVAHTIAPRIVRALRAAESGGVKAGIVALTSVPNEGTEEER